MRGVLGLALIVIGLSMAWLIILGKFPPATAGQGLLGELGTALTSGGPSASPASAGATK